MFKVRKVTAFLGESILHTALHPVWLWLGALGLNGVPELGKTDE
jgi:hypothetical protein